MQTGDGHNFNITGGPDWGDTPLKLKLVGGSLSAVDWFMPYNQACIEPAELSPGPGGPKVPAAQARPHASGAVRGG